VTSIYEKKNGLRRGKIVRCVKQLAHSLEKIGEEHREKTPVRGSTNHTDLQRTVEFRTGKKTAVSRYLFKDNRAERVLTEERQRIKLEEVRVRSKEKNAVEKGVSPGKG